MSGMSEGALRHAEDQMAAVLRDAPSPEVGKAYVDGYTAAMRSIVESLAATKAGGQMAGACDGFIGAVESIQGAVTDLHNWMVKAADQAGLTRTQDGAQ